MNNRRGVVGAAMLAAAALLLASCSTLADKNDRAEGPQVPVGAGAAEYQAALADIDPIELVVQWHTSSPTDPGSASLDGFLQRVNEYSGGKITFDVTYANGVTGNVLDNMNALVDGRLDIAHYWPQYDPAEYPVNNLLLNASVVRDPGAVSGYFSILGAMQELGLSTPEALAEWTDKGVTPLNIMSADGPTIVVCREPVDSLADLQGRQIRSGGTVHSRQIEALGGVPVSLPFPEIYEALQRGIIDCSMSAHWIATAAGHVETSPYVYHAEGASLASTPTNLYAGPRLNQLPAAARQLIIESAQYNAGGSVGPVLARTAVETVAIAERQGGGYFAFPAEVDARLEKVNAELLAELEANPALSDGAAFVARARELNDKWLTLVRERGYEDGGPASTFPRWYAGAYPPEAWIDLAVDEIVAEYWAD